MRTHAVLLLSISPTSECEENAIVVRNKVLLSSYWPCDLDLWLLTLKLVGIIAHGWATFHTNFGVEGCRTFRSRLIGQHLSDAWRDLATFTFDLGGHGACCWYGSSCSVSVPSLNFVGLPVRKILGIYCVSINPPGDLDLWPLYSQTNRLTRKSYPRQPTKSTWVIS